MKKAVAVILAIALVVGIMCCFSACSDEKQLKIVYLGDSIAEAVLGPSPLSERDNYGYYALIGKCNGYGYINRSVSGHKTEHMLAYISREDTDATMINTHLRTADIIQVSILGNDMLQSGLTELIMERAREKAGELTAEDTDREAILKHSHENFAAIIAKLKELNPTATLLVQTVYNPVYPGTPIIGKKAHNLFTDPKYDFPDENSGEIKCYREIGGEILATLNDVVYKYHEAHPDDFYIVDVYEAFKKIYDEDAARGKNLIYPDGIHPSNEGHAVIAEATLEILTELGYSDPVKVLGVYKDIKLDQLKRLYPTVDKAVHKQIREARDFGEVTNIYFRATDGLIPELV